MLRGPVNDWLDLTARVTATPVAEILQPNPEW